MPARQPLPRPEWFPTRWWQWPIGLILITVVSAGLGLCAGALVGVLLWDIGWIVGVVDGSITDRAIKISGSAGAVAGTVYGTGGWVLRARRRR